MAVLAAALSGALAAVRTLGPAAEKKAAVPSADMLGTISPALMQEMTGRIREAAEMGDITQVNEIAGEMKSRSADLAPICDRFMNLAADFDFDGITKLLEEFEINR
jgi:hypothetical protein